MPITLQLHGHASEIIDDLQRLFPSLVAGTSLPPMQEQPRENREPLPESNVKEIEPPKQRKPRTPKEKEAAEGDKGEPAPATPEPSDSSKDSSTASTTEQKSAEQSSAVPDIEDLRARLKTLGATEGFGHDKVFEVLGKYGAKNASTVPDDKRAACIAEIDEMLKAGK